MQSLLPFRADPIDPMVEIAAEARTVEKRPWIAVNMASTVDGAIQIGGVSGPIGGAGDRRIFRALRATADVIVVAGGTARAERYGAPRLDDRSIEARVARGQSPLPTLAVISGSVDFGRDDRLFDDGHVPLILTTESAPTHRLDELAERIEPVVVGEARVEMHQVRDALFERGHRTILCEGGPRLNAQLVGDNLVDEICLTLAPRLTDGESKRIVDGVGSTLRDLELVRVFEEDGELFLRYLRRG